jgi:hypothetical protein
MATPTNSPADRVSRYRAEYGDKTYAYEDGRAAVDQALAVTVDNALAALAEGQTAEANVWTDLALVAQYKYRRSAR